MCWQHYEQFRILFFYTQTRYSCLPCSEIRGKKMQIHYIYVYLYTVFYHAITELVGGSVTYKCYSRLRIFNLLFIYFLPFSVHTQEASELTRGPLGLKSNYGAMEATQGRLEAQPYKYSLRRLLHHLPPSPLLQLKRLTVLNYAGLIHMNDARDAFWGV